MTHRPAATLVEVLVAIFVTAIGLLALLTLFPLGALSMAQAIKDDRTAHSAKNANAIFWTYFNANLVGNAGYQPRIQNDPTVLDCTQPLPPGTGLSVYQGVPG